MSKIPISQIANLSVCTTVPGERLVNEENRHNEHHDCRASTTIVRQPRRPTTKCNDGYGGSNCRKFELDLIPCCHDRIFLEVLRGEFLNRDCACNHRNDHCSTHLALVPSRTSTRPCGYGPSMQGHWPEMLVSILEVQLHDRRSAPMRMNSRESSLSIESSIPRTSPCSRSCRSCKPWR